MHISHYLLITILIVMLFNVPFGYWRYNVRKLSLQWFLAVHFPVPFIILLRLCMDIGFHWTTYVFLIGAFFCGQLFGGRLHKSRKRFRAVSSCLIMDLLRNN